MSPKDILEGKKEGKEKVFDEKAKERINSIIIHIHGGGFISMSSFSHQNYTRVWANQIPNSVVFSIDYRLAPASRFPD